MKEKLRIWPAKCLTALTMLMLALAISVLIGRIGAPDAPALWLLPCALAYLWAIVGYLMPKKGKLLWTVLGILLCAAGGAVFLLPRSPLALSLIVPGLVLLLVLPPAWARPLWDEWPLGLWLGGILVHLAGQFMAVRPLFSGTKDLLMGCFLVYAFLFLLYLNRNGIRDGMHGSEKAPAALRTRNTILVIGLFLLGAAASAWSTLAQWLDQLWQWIKLGVASVIAFFTSLLPDAGPAGGGGGMGGADMLSGLMEEAEPSPFAVFMEKVMYVLSMILLAVLVFFALRTMIRQVRKLWKKLVERLRQYAADTAEDYTDEAENTLNWEERTQSFRDQVKRSFQRGPRQPRWEELNGRDRVRRLYQQYIKKKPDAQGHTAREALRQDRRISSATANRFMDLYEQARYSNHDVSAQSADDLRRQL